MNAHCTVRVHVNGESHERSVEPRLLLCDFLRQELGLTGTHVGCEHGVCGACTVLLDGEAVRSCLIFAVQVDSRDILTVEGLAANPPVRNVGGPVDPETRHLHPLQIAFREAHALQCGFCTPGILMSLVPFLREEPNPTEEKIREGLSGHLCRCTGYQNIVDAVKLAATRMAGGSASGAAAGAPHSGPRDESGRQRAARVNSEARGA
ncbi:MAG: (2Fe-2S)-binding protein [Gemmatimonadota bacterium]